MPASRLLDILEKDPHQIGFVSPEKWYDPYEIKFLNTDYTALNQSLLRRHIFHSFP